MCFKLKKKSFIIAVVLAVFIISVVQIDDIYSSFQLRKPQNDYEWLRNENNLTSFVQPNQFTAKIEPRNVSKSLLITCFVMSAPQNARSRSAIRKTWGKHIKPVFLLGIGENETMIQVEQEAKKFDDIIVEDFIDSYFNLTVKTAFAMKTFLRHFMMSKYFMKIDDDVYLNVGNLNQMLEGAPSEALIGMNLLRKKPIREYDSKWYVPQFLFSNDEYPPYLNGPAYIIPGRFMQNSLFN